MSDPYPNDGSATLIITINRNPVFVDENNLHEVLTALAVGP